MEHRSKLTINILCAGLILGVIFTGTALYLRHSKEKSVLNQQLMARKEKNNRALENEQDEFRELVENEHVKSDERDKREEQKRLENQKNLSEEQKKRQEQERIAAEKKIPILMYHYVQDGINDNDLVVPKGKFREQMKYLKENGYTTLSMDELLFCLTSKVDVPSKPVAITFDDGYEDNYTDAYPILKEFGLKATIFMISKRVDQPRFLTSQEVLELDKNMVNIESHTANHKELAKMTFDMQMAEFRESKSELEKLLGRPVKYVAYPNGSFNNDTIRAVKMADYNMGFSTIRGLGQKSNGLYTVHRVYVGARHNLEQFKGLLEGRFN